MRDLHAVGAQGRNGAAAVEDPYDEAAGPQGADTPRAALDRRTLEIAMRISRHDNRLASVAVLLLDAAQQLYPMADMLSKLSLRWAALGISSALAFYAATHATMPWERLAITGAFMVGSALIWWKR